MTCPKLSNVNFSVLEEEFLFLSIVSSSGNSQSSFKQLMAFAANFVSENNVMFFFNKGFFVREFSSDSKNQISLLKQIFQISFWNPSEMCVKWIPNFELFSENTQPLFQPEKKNWDLNSEEFKTETFFLDECRFDFGLKLAGEELGQSFLELICLQPVLIRLTFEKKSRQLVNLSVKPKKPLFFQKLFLVQDLCFVVRQNLALRSFYAEIQNLEELQRKVTLSVYWNSFHQSEVLNFAPLCSEVSEQGQSQSKGTFEFERTVSFDVGELRRQIRNNEVTVFFNWKTDLHFAPKSQSKGASEAFLAKKGPQAFRDAFLAKNCKVVFKIGNKKLEILEFKNPQTITGRSSVVRFPEDNFACWSQTWIFEPLNK